VEGPQLEFSDTLHAEKYRHGGETFKEAMNRVASALKDNDEHYFKTRDILLGMRFLPGGRIQSAIGSSKRTTPYNCFVSGTIEDSFVDGHGSIMERAKEAATTMRMGGGIGYDFSTLRPRGALIRKLSSKSSGPISFMDIFDAICRCVASSGHRRGAQMGVLRVDHPDIEEFVHAKQNGTRLTGFNISIAVTDGFMQCVESGTPFMLKFAGENYREIDARALWEQIMRSTWDWAEPGVLFIDAINRMNNLYYCEQIAATNPCFTGDTHVWTAEYGPVQFSTLAEANPESVLVLTQLPDGKLVYRKMANIRRTATKAKLVRIKLDNGGEIRCTPNHVFYMRDGSECKAKDLQPKDSLASVYRHKANSKGYLNLLNGIVHPLEHHVPFEGIKGLGSKVHTHHINGKKGDNRPSNLEVIDSTEHQRLHMSGDSNPLRRMPGRNPMKLFPDCTRGPKNGRWRDEVSTEKILELRGSGLSFNKIAKQVGCSKYTVQHRIKTANHKVISVEFLEEVEDVFCGTVEETNRFFIQTGKNDGVLVHNCGEQPLPPYGACLLGSFNLAKYVDKNDNNAFRLGMLEEDIPHVVRAMDNVVDRAVYPLYEQEKEARSKRRMGLGVTGLANACEAQGLKYGTPEFISLTETILRIIKEGCYRASIDLAKEKGSFPKYEDEYLDGQFIRSLSEETRAGIKRHGIRNSHLTSIAPTGTISLCADNVSSGIEPVFSHKTERTVIEFEGPRKITVEDYGVKNFGVFGKKAADVSIDEHLAVLVAASEHVDSSVSKTCNVPASTKWEDFKNLYFQAWKNGCKGCTTFQMEGKRAPILKDVEPSSCAFDPATGRRDCN